MCIDEWPQFTNIAKGEMLLVGPRPLLRETTRWDLFSDKHLELREKCKPGLLSPIYYKPFNSGSEARQNELDFILERLQKPVYAQIKYAFMIIFNLVTYRIKNESCRPASFGCGKSKPVAQPLEMQLAATLQEAE